MNTNLKMAFKNNYHVELIEEATGNVKQSGDFHNIAVVNLWQAILGHGNTGASGKSGPALANYMCIMSGIRVGSGEAEPAFTNTALTNTLWSTAASSYNFEWVGDYTGRATGSYSFPATSAYVGTVKEVGLCNRAVSSNALNNNNTYNLMTHALLTDSEGKQISFDKTDLDILVITVTVELTITGSDSGFKIFKKPFIVSNILVGNVMGYNYNYSSAYGSVNLCKYHTDMELANAAYTRVIDKALGATCTYVDSSTEHYITWPSLRVLATDVTDETYYKAVAIPGIGYWTLPNEDIFPAYTISNIPIGTGDGETTQFENPLCYFKENTDKVYKNGVQLTRDVDYVLNHSGNKNCLPEVSEFTLPIKVQSALKSVTNLAKIPIMFPTALSYGVIKETIADSGLSGLSLTFNSSNPLYVEYDEEVTFNCLKCVGTFVAYSGNNGFNNVPVGTTFYIDYSLDGETYIEAGSYVTVDSKHNFTLDFTEATAKYWRLRVSTTVSGELGFSSNVSTAQYMTLNRKDPYIVFAEAPAEGDVITMDVDMDVIMKNSNFVIDIGCRVDFSL